MKKLLFYYEKKDNKYQSYQVIDEERLEIIEKKHSIEETIKKYNENEKNINYCKIIDDESVIEAFFQKEKYDTIKSNCKDILESIERLKSEISDISYNVKGVLDKIDERIEEDKKGN